MALRRCLVEMGMGVDLRGQDYTKAAQRAVWDAIGHNSLGFLGVIGGGARSMYVDVTIGVPRPEGVDSEAVLSVLPHGTGRINVVQGGLEVPSEDGSNASVMANAAVIVSLEV